MITITPCQRMISDRFPVASFVVHAPPDRLFEIACATDPALFRGDQRHRRTPANFFTSRTGGLLRAPAGQATYLLPPEQLRRFAGQPRLYYALGAYASPRGDGAVFTVPPERPAAAPFIRMAPEFTARTLDRTRLGRREQQDRRYGAAAAVLAWGGDRTSVAETDVARPNGRSDAYDDGYPTELWHAAGPAAEPMPPPARPTVRHGGYADEPAGAEHAADLAPVIGSSEATWGPAPAYGRPHRAPADTYRYGRAPRVDGEPPGAEDAPALRGAGHGTFGGRAAATVGGEPAGFEDGPALRHTRPEARYGNGAAAPSLPPPSEAPAESRPGVDDEFDEAPPDDAAFAPAFLESVRSDGGAPLGIPDKFRLVLPVAAFESGSERYTAVGGDREFNDPTHPAYQRMHHGLHWGLIQFPQRSGALGRVLLACRRRDPARFAELFGPAADDLVRTTTAATPEERTAPVDGAYLWEEPWLGRFRAAGNEVPFQAAQNEVAIEGTLDPNLPFAACLGFTTDRALAMLFDRCVGMGNGAGRRWIVEAVSPITGDAQVMRALSALGFPDLAAFQRHAGLTGDGVLRPLTHAALIAALRALGEESPLPVPALPGMLDALVVAARGRRFEPRMAALRTTSELTDTVRRVP